MNELMRREKWLPEDETEFFSSLCSPITVYSPPAPECLGAEVRRPRTKEERLTVLRACVELLRERDLFSLPGWTEKDKEHVVRMGESMLLLARKGRI